ncbi:hypothetical protein C1645_827583 [Glomus cerebriforme]|uniref:Vacuolar membrane-associated protein IML1 n=1 Tax=Glomus cerebriforme TaxID=658196 RepID=A0A397SXX1_9GLOM|nr:hypothetical protein C1645_827583 [Glomus cerebriforme]
MDADSSNATTSNALYSIQNKPPTPIPTPPPPSSYSSSNTTNTITIKSLRYKMLNLWVHNEIFSKQDFILNPDFFPGIKLGQLLEIYPSNEESDVAKHLIVKVDSLDKENIGKEKPILQISVSSNIANIFKFKTRTNVLVREVDAELVAADYIEFTFKDQYIGRSDMWRLSRNLIDTCVYTKQKIIFAGCIRAQVKKIFVKGEQVSCGYVTENTKPIFRSESAKLFIFVQMSREMWEFDEDGELYYEKAIDGFFTELFQRWKDLGTNHVVSIVLFSRVYYENEEVIDNKLVNDDSLGQIRRKWYKDFYKVIVDWETRTDWNSALKQLKEELTQYQLNILLRDKKGQNGESYKILLGKNSYAFEGNILEAINLALNPFDRHYVDRDLLRTGLSIIIVTPGCCRFEVDKKLLRLTAERMIDNGIGLDLVCLSRIPLHTVPLFKFTSQELSKAPLPDWWNKNTSRFGSKFSSQSKDSKIELRDPLDYDDDPNDDSNHNYYKTPDWIDCNFYSRHQDKPFKPDKFITRCKMYEIQMMGIMEHEISCIIIPFLNDDSQSSSSVNNEFDNYDDNVFVTFKQNESPLRQQKSQDSLNHLNDSSPPSFCLQNSDSPISQRQGNIFKPRLTDLLVEENSLHPTIMNRISRSYSQTSHDSYQDGPSKSNELTDDDDENVENVVTSSTVDPIKIKSSNRNHHQQQRNYVSLSPKRDSYTEGSYFFKNLPRPNYHPIPLSSNPSLIHHPPNYRTPLVNPWNPSKSNHRYGMSTHLRRWRHVFPRPLSINSIKWPALCTPACLPLTTDYLSPIDEPGAYDEYTYTISVEPENFIMNKEHDITEESKTEILLKEMISQRLAQGYQLVIPSEIKSPNWEDNSLTLLASKPYYLSMGRHVHKLTYDPSGQVVEVKRYVRKIQYEPKPIPYNCAVWPKCQETYELRTVDFTYPHIDYKWNYVDQLICGYQVDLYEHLKFWRTRFILIPVENIPDNLLKHGNELFEEEEVRLNGIYKFLELFDKSLWVSPHEITEVNCNKKKEYSSPHLKPTTDDLSIFVIAPEGLYPRRSSVHPVDEKLTKDSRLEKIYQAMKNNTTGIIKDRQWHFRPYQNAIIGNEFVDWLIARFHDIETRTDAVAFGNELLDRGLYEHCQKRHRFLDGYFFYQIKEEFAPRKATKRWFKKVPKKDSDKIEEKPTKPMKIEFTKAIHIDIDPNKKSDRRETATLHYDVIYNVDTCYHFQLNWLGCTARLIEELLQQWSRNADKYGLKLVEAPVEQAMSLTDNNPFQSPTSIKLSVLPPSLEELEKLGKKLNPEINQNLYFEIELVKHFKFILDVEADDRFPKEVDIIYSYHKTPYKYSQYIHRSGVAFIQICNPGEGFLWVNNRAYTTHAVSNKNYSPNPDQLLKEFQNFCNDEAVLKKFWKDVTNSIEDFKPPDDDVIQPYNINTEQHSFDNITEGNNDGGEGEPPLTILK